MQNFSQTVAQNTAINLAEEVRRTRLAQNVTQSDIAARVGISPATYFRFEKTGDITLKKFLEIIRALGRGGDVTFLALNTPRSIEELERRAASRQRARKTQKQGGADNAA
ncbi:MAG: helix-turn-helix domain-containing protein [Puniceicoccales bacterium]|jgi:transcriptional regulator with XRE-family HTH domain|nr:helix-turn-helix domain-containing protein [Puniceicoccales bacterium]